MQGKIYKKNIIRIAFIAILSIPIFFLHDFYVHFKAYLTGTIINSVITNQWEIVVVSIVLFLLFLIPLSFRRKAKWVEYSLVAAFFVSLFIEMYGIPLTILFASKYFFTNPENMPPNVVNFHWLGVGFGMDLAMAYGAIIIALGTFIILIGWVSLYRKAKKKSTGLVTTGIYRYSRHPQYVGFLMVIIGWFIGWPTILTVIFTPILIYKYVRVCKVEEKEMQAKDPHYQEYQKTVPFLL